MDIANSPVIFQDNSEMKTKHIYNFTVISKDKTLCKDI